MKDIYQSWRMYHDKVLERYNDKYSMFGAIINPAAVVFMCSIVFLLFTLLSEREDNTIVYVCIFLALMSILVVLIGIAARVLIGQKMKERIKFLEKRRVKRLKRE